MSDTTIVTAVEQKQSTSAYDLIEKALYRRAGVFLTEKKKSVAAKCWPTRVISEGKEEDLVKAKKRKELKDKLKKKVVK